MRVFEALACGSLLVTNDLAENGQEELFRDREHLVTYRNADELLDKLDYYLRHDGERERIAAAGRNEVVSRHTYRHRMESLLHGVDRRKASVIGVPRQVGTGCEPARCEPHDDPSWVAKLRRLSDAHPWPADKPHVTLPHDSLGWLGDGAQELLARELTLETKLVVELGSWLGKSARFIANLAPHATVIAVDHWRGSPEHQNRADWRAMLPTLYETFLAMSWAYRDRLIPLRMTTLEGLRTVFQYDLSPDLVYVDSEHSYDTISAELTLITTLFRNAVIVGDDYDEPEVARALADFARSRDLSVQAEGKDWKAWTIVQPSRVLAADSDQCGEPESPPQHMLDLIPKSARTILQLGRQANVLADVTKTREPTDIRVIDIASAESELPNQTFAVILCGDSLEQTHQPLRLLRRARDCLEPGGRLIATFANVRYHSVLRGLLQGNWTYDSNGIVCEERLRFFTRREIEKLFYRAGFALDSLQIIPGLGYRDWEEHGRQGTVSLGALQIQGLRPEDAQEFYVHGYVVSAVLAPVSDYGLTSIVIVTHNQLEYTRRCVESILRLTDEPIELIFVDNGSSDGTVHFLRSLPNAQIIVNDQNRGFPAAVNQGIQTSTGRQILLLNNDTVVTTGWLRRLLRALHSDPTIGLVGPCSNCVSGSQQIPTTYGDDLTGLDGFAWALGMANDRSVEQTDRLVGFCLFFRREVVDRIGLMDEQFGVGCFEDDDFTRRAIEGGFRAVIAQDALVHHYGGRTFIATGVDFAGLMARNEQLFRQKWSNKVEATAHSPVIAQEVEKPAAQRFSVKVGDQGGLFLVPAKARISLCMIARDNKRTIAAAIKSAQRCVEEIIVVDTGSVDDTPQIAASLGARVYHFPWCDDFSAARNESLKYATGDWIFWMDTDDTIDEENARRLRELPLERLDPSVLGIVMQVHCPGPGADGEVSLTVVDHVKLFRNLPHLRFERRIHEQILQAINRAGGQTVWSDLFVVHSGYDHSPDGQRRKLERDLRLLHLELDERPNDTFTLFNLGMTYSDDRAFDDAISYLRQSVDSSGPAESHLRKAFALLVHAYHQTKRFDEAWEACRRGLDLFSDDVELRFRQAILLQDRGRLHEAAEVIQGILQDTEQRHFSSVVTGLIGFMARHNLAMIYDELGDLARAEEQWRLITQEAPRYRDGWRGLGDVFIKQGKHDEALGLAEKLLADEKLHSEGIEIRSWVHRARGVLR